MVTDNHYRWDFIGLSTDTKPTPATSEKVVDGSTFYCSDTSKLYVYCKDDWYERKPLGGGGTTYTAGTGIDITDGTISVDDDVVATLQELNARIAKGEGAPTTATEGVVGGLYEDNTNGKLYICTAVTPGTDPDPDTYTWEEVGAGGGGGGDTVYSTKTTSNSADGGAVYIGAKNASQTIYQDPTTTDNHRRYFWALPFNPSATANTSTPGDCTINIGGDQSPNSENNITIGYSTKASGNHNVNIGFQAGSTAAYGSCVCIGESAQCLQNYGVAIGRGANTASGNTGSVALGAYSLTSRQGEVNIGTSQSYAGYNSSNYRVLGGVYDGQDLHDAATVAQGNTLSTSAPDTSTVGVLGQLWTDTTNMHTYQCTAISGSTYTWTQRW